MSGVMVRLPKAQARVLNTARTVGFVMIDGAFSGEATAHWTDPGTGTGELQFCEGFDSRTMVEKCFALGYLKLGRMFNQYVLTDLGEAMVPAGEQIAA